MTLTLIPHINEIIQCLSLCVWLNSLSIMSTMFIYVVANDRISFFYYGWIIISTVGFVCVTFSLSNLLLMNTYLAIIQNAAMNERVLWDSELISFGCISKNRYFWICSCTCWVVCILIIEVWILYKFSISYRLEIIFLQVILTFVFSNS